MPIAYLCHAPSDAEAALELGGWLELNTPCEVRFSECGPGCDYDVVEAADQAMGADAVVLLLSPASVPEKWVRSHWEPVLIHQPARGVTALASVVLEECRFPELLRRRDCFAWNREGRRALKRWLLARFPQVVSLPAEQGEAGPAEIEELRRALADRAGVAEDVPRERALGFARNCAGDFEGAVWIDGTRRTAAGIAGDLGEALGLTSSGPPEESLARLREFCAARRLLVVFDNCGTDTPEVEGRSSVLRTRPHQGPALRGLSELTALFSKWTESPELCLEALRDLPTAIESHGWDEVRELSTSAVGLLGHRKRAAELLELAELLIPRARAAGDDPAVRRLEWERGWILEAWGRPEPVTAPIMPPAAGDQLTLPFPVG